MLGCPSWKAWNIKNGGYMQKILMIDDDLQIEREVFPLVEEAAKHHGWEAVFWNPGRVPEESEIRQFMQEYEFGGDFPKKLGELFLNKVRQISPNLILLDNRLTHSAQYGVPLTAVIQSHCRNIRIYASSNKSWSPSIPHFDKYEPTDEAINALFA